MATGYDNTVISEEQRREFVLDFIRRKSLITVKDNLILSEKVFVINAVLKWCYQRAYEKKMTPALWEKYKKSIAQYIAGVVEIRWADNNFEIIEIIDEKVKPTKPPRRKRRSKTRKPS